jgi:hypothetical protein
MSSSDNMRNGIPQLDCMYRKETRKEVRRMRRSIKRKRIAEI